MLFAVLGFARRGAAGLALPSLTTKPLQDGLRLGIDLANDLGSWLNSLHQAYTLPGPHRKGIDIAKNGTVTEIS